MKIAIGNDHSALELKAIVIKHLEDNGPIYGEKVALAIKNNEAELGILICGTGIGISLAANKVPGIRAAVCSEPYSAKMTRAHNNANILAFGARVVGQDLAKMIVDAFVNTKFEGERHQRRVDMLTEIEQKYSK